MTAARWLVTGAGGQLGSDLLQVLSTVDEITAVGMTRSDLDISVESEVDAVVAEVRPAVLINAAAFTAVDAAETAPAAATAVNATAAGLLARACAAHGARLVQVSTDYVFAGEATEPYPVDAPTGPRSVYGQSKLAGERAVRALLPDASYVVRTAWVYGAVGGNFVKTMARLERDRETVEVVDDQRGSPTWSADLARGLIALGRSAAPAGIYHCTNSGDTTWYVLTRAIFEELGADPGRVRPTSSDRFPRPAPRPAYSVLSPAAWLAAGLPAMPPWRDALHRAFAEIRPALTPAAPAASVRPPASADPAGSAR
jgi:dTDP-4-dehydrorhamnose reductase